MSGFLKASAKRLLCSFYNHGESKHGIDRIPQLWSQKLNIPFFYTKLLYRTEFILAFFTFLCYITKRCSSKKISFFVKGAISWKPDSLASKLPPVRHYTISRIYFHIQIHWQKRKISDTAKKFPYKKMHNRKAAGWTDTRVQPEITSALPHHSQ